MKKVTIPMILLMLILTACGAKASAAGSGSNTNPANAELPLATQLIIGGFKLEGTPQAITADQAKQLIPLWQVYKDLSSSDASAQQEVEALVTQIQGVMTADQLKAITDMKLTRQDMFATLQAKGISFGRPNATGTRTPGNSQPGGGFPGGFPGQGGQRQGGGGQGGGFTPQQAATAQAFRQQQGGSRGFGRVPAPLIDAYIQYLQGIAGA